MILICERCFNPIGLDEEYIGLAHVDQANPDGSIEWVYAYLHSGAKSAHCTAPAGEVSTDRAA